MEKKKENSPKHPHRELPHSFTLSLAAKVAAMVTGAKRGACHLNREAGGRWHREQGLNKLLWAIQQEKWNEMGGGNRCVKRGKLACRGREVVSFVLNPVYANRPDSFYCAFIYAEINTCEQIMCADQSDVHPTVTTVFLSHPLCSVSTTPPPPPPLLKAESWCVTDRQPRTAWLDTPHSREATMTETEQRGLEENRWGRGVRELTKGVFSG